MLLTEESSCKTVKDKYLNRKMHRHKKHKMVINILKCSAYIIVKVNAITFCISDIKGKNTGDVCIDRWTLVVKDKLVQLQFFWSVIQW